MTPLGMPVYDGAAGFWGFAIAYVVCAFVWGYPLWKILPKYAYDRRWAFSTLLVGGLAVLIALWLIALPDKWTPPEENT
ncbi:hypothetical protein [Puniceibacterium sediminis]|uniref:Uncharacterized protein n=1 Tax=Puniceibacterium sediminis TaxID=1608407 RepID=A0A238W898_9RHOB|nr:hypothetical protein [Puniceibacterium sediminis]SNR42621.1 hypothetical protein SAMN06265370_104240 [Puniceibacterium sediminis]